MIPIYWLDSSSEVLAVETADPALWITGLPSPAGPLYIDCETSGLRTDSGARVSALSAAWRTADGGFVSWAVPLDQGYQPGKDGPIDSKTGLSRGPLGHAPDCASLVATWPSRGRSARTGLPTVPAARRTGIAQPAPEHADKCDCRFPHNLTPAAYAAVLDVLCGMVESSSGLVGQNFGFDRHMLAAGHRLDPDGATARVLPPAIWDTQIASAIMFPTFPSNLKPTAARLFGARFAAPETDLKEWLSAQGTGLKKRYDLAPWPLIGPYAAFDTYATMLIHEHQTTLIAEGDCDRDVDLVLAEEFETANTIWLMEHRGLPLDVAGITAEGQKLTAEANLLAEKLPFEATPAKAANFWFGPAPSGLALTPSKLTPGGAPSVDREAVKALIDANAPWAAEYARVMSLRSMVSKFYSSWAQLAGPDGRLRTSYRQVPSSEDFRAGSGSDGGTVSGRLSSQSPNLQQIPRNTSLPAGVRGPKSFLRAEPGHELWEIDQSASEVHILCWYTRSRAFLNTLIHAKETGTKIHTLNTMAIYGLKPGDPGFERAYHSSKTGIFCVAYGGGYKALTEQLGITMDEAREFKDKMNRAYPEIEQFTRLASRRFEAGRPLRLANGRMRWPLPLEYSNKAGNQVIQGGNAVVTKRWFNRVEREFPGALVGTVHDSIKVMVPVGHPGAQAIERMREINNEEMRKFFWSPDFPVPHDCEAHKCADEFAGTD